MLDNENNKTNTSYSADKRVKVFDYMPYKNRKQGSKDILWPFYSYNILVSASESSNENVLEHIVYRMLKVKNGDVQATAQILCLDIDLVDFIVSKLKENGEIDENNLPINNNYNDELSSENVSSSFLPPSEEESNSGTIVSVKVFKDISDHKNYMLPFVFINDDNIALKVVKDQSYDSVEYAFDNEESKIIKAQKIPMCRNISTKLEKTDVIQAVKDYKKLCKNNISEIFDRKRKILDRLISGNFKIKENPEIIYLHLSASIETNMYDIMISDFWGKGNYYVLSRKINEAIRDDKDNKYIWCKNFKESKLSNTELFSIERDIPSLPKEYGSEDYFKEAQILRSKLKQNIASNEEAIENDEAIEKIFKNLYLSIEYALGDLYKLYYAEDLISVIVSKSEDANKNLVKKISEKFSLNLSTEEISFFKISKYRFNNLDNEPDMQGLLLLNLWEANNHLDHPILKLLKDVKSPISFIIRLKSFRDKAYHNSDGNYISLKNIDNYISNVKSILEILNPKIKGINLQNQKDSNDDQKVLVTDYILRSRIFLDDKLGPGFLQSLSHNYAEIILNITKKYFLVLSSKILLDKQKFMSDYFNDMYKLLEAIFSENIKQCNKNKQEIKEFITKGIENEFGIHLSDKGPIYKVRTEGVQRVLEGKGFSLQAILVALLISSNTELIKSFLKHCNSYSVDFIEFIEQIIIYRGHGTNTNINISDDEFEKIYKYFLFTFKSFVEFF